MPPDSEIDIEPGRDLATMAVAPERSGAEPDDGALTSSRRIARGAAFRAGGEVLGKAASTIFFIVMARELGRDGFGDFVFALSLAGVLMLASGFGTEELIAREVARDRRRVHGYLADVLALKSSASVVLLLIAVAVVNLGDFPSEARIAVYIVGLGVAVENLGRTFYAVFTAYERLEMISISLVIQRALTAAVGIATLLAGGGLIAVSIVFLGGAIVGVFVALYVLRRYVVAPRWRLDRSRWVPLMKAGVPIGLASLLFTVLLKVDATLLGLLAGGDDNSEVGLYGAAYRLVEATLFISWAFSASTLPWLARREDAALAARGFELGAKVITIVLMPIALCFVLLAPEIVELLYGPGYEGAVLPLRLLGLMTVLYGVNSLAATVLISRDRPKDFTMIVALVALLNIILNIILIPRHGAVAAAFNAALSGVLLAGLSVALVARRVGAVRLVRAFAAPVIGGSMITAVFLAAPIAPVFAFGLALAAYVGTVIAFERLTYPSDFGRLRAAAQGLLPGGTRLSGDG